MLLLRSFRICLLQFVHLDTRVEKQEVNTLWNIIYIRERTFWKLVQMALPTKSS